MNKLTYILLFCTTGMLLSSCKKEGLITYNTSDNIFFALGSLANRPGANSPDSINVSFAYSPSSVKDSIIRLPLAVTGVPHDRDRSFRAEVVADSTTAVAGVHYVLPDQLIIHAGRVMDSLPVKIIRTPDLQTGTIVLRLRLVPGGDFNTDIKTVYDGGIGVLSMKLNISEFFPPWNAGVNTYFGPFSLKKVKLINEITGMPLDYYAQYIYDLNGSARLTLYAIAMSRYLKDQKAAGHTVYEDDGITEMVMGPTYQ